MQLLDFSELLAARHIHTYVVGLIALLEQVTIGTIRATYVGTYVISVDGQDGILLGGAGRSTVARMEFPLGTGYLPQNNYKRTTTRYVVGYPTLAKPRHL